MNENKNKNEREKNDTKANCKGNDALTENVASLVTRPWRNSARAGIVKRTIKTLARPVQFCAGLIHKGENNSKAKRVTECALGFCVCIGGATISAFNVATGGALHTVLEASAWLVHGFGSAPIIDALTSKGAK